MVQVGISLSSDLGKWADTWAGEGDTGSLAFSFCMGCQQEFTWEPFYTNPMQCKLGKAHT
jgi:hypothetical protein